MEARRDPSITPGEFRGRRHEITHPNEFSQLRSVPLLRRHGAAPVVILDDRISAEKRAEWADQLNRSYLACGCVEGSLGMIAGLGVFGLYAAVARPDLSLWAYIGLFVLAAAVGSAAGKLVGLWAADRRLRALAARIRSEWDAPPREEKESWRCG